MIRYIILVYVCLFIVCNNTDKQNALTKNVSKQIVSSAISKDVVATQTVPYDTSKKTTNDQFTLPTSSESVSVVQAMLSDTQDGWTTRLPHEEDEKVNGTVILRDTLIPISKGCAILYREYNKTLELWYKPHIINVDKRDTVRISDNNDYESGSELGFNVSPNVKYVVLDYIDRGFLGTGELHNHNYDIIVDIKNATIITQLDGTDRDGEWDDKDNWISRGKIIFNSETKERKY